jgi:outer membrane protein
MKTLVVAASLALLATVYSMTARGQTPPSRETPQIGYIAAQRVINESKDAAADVARLQATQQQRTTELKVSQQALAATRQQLEQATDSTRAPLQQRVQQQQADLDRATAQMQTDLQTLQRQMQAEIQTRVRAAADQVGREQNLQLILNGDTAVVWAAPGLDVTAAVIDRVNATATPAASAPAPRH